MRRGEQSPWVVPDGLWQRIEPLLPQPRRTPGTGTEADTESAGRGILFIPHTGIHWEFARKNWASGRSKTCWHVVPAGGE